MAAAGGKLARQRRSPWRKWGILASLLTYQHSFGGAAGSDRKATSVLAYQPVATINLGEGFTLRSSAIWTFDTENDTHYIPVGLGIGKTWTVGSTAASAFVEPQYTVWHHGREARVPRLQVFTGVTFQFASGK